MSAVTADPIAVRIPIYVTQGRPQAQVGDGRTYATVAHFVVDPACPDLLSVTCPSISLDLDREGVKQGMSEPWTAPNGQVIVSPCGSDDARWLVVDLNIASLPVAQVFFRLDRIADFLSMADALLDFTSDQFADEIAAWMGAEPEVTG